MPRRSATLRDALIAAALAAAVVATRLPLAGAVLYHWDSLNYALALERFDIAADQPHPPGYPIYIAIARAVNAIVRDPQQTFVGISAVSSGLAVAALYGLGAALFDRRVGLAAAVFLASSPLFWFYGAIAMPHAVDAFVVAVAVWLLYAVARGRTALAIPAAIWLGLAGGLRQQTQVFLAPLMLYAAWSLSWRQRLLSLAALVAVDLAWFVPLVATSGGLDRYAATVQAFYLETNAATSIFSGGGWWGLRRNLSKLALYTPYGWGVAALPALLAAAVLWRRGRLRGTTVRRDERIRVISLWVIPCLTYYALVHMGQQGLTFIYLCALLLVSAWAIARAWPRQLAALSAAVVLGNALILLAAPTFPLGGDNPKILTRDTLRRHDEYFATRFAVIPRQFDPRHTIVLASSWRFMEVYLPAFSFLKYDIAARWERMEGAPRPRAVWIGTPQDAGVAPDADGIVTVVLFDDELEQFNDSRERAVIWPIGHGQRLTTFDWRAGERLRMDSHSFGIESVSEREGEAPAEPLINEKEASAGGAQD